MRHVRTAGAFAFGLALALASGEREAHACGGCFVPQGESTVVNDHRMAFSISKKQTVLWDQIRYSGDPREFAWILPIHPGARVELSNDAWIAALDATTQPVINAPVQPMNGGGGCGCGFMSGSADSASAGGGTPPVQVISQETIGPYETSTIRSTDAHALEDWLTAHGYAIPESIGPTIAAYASEGFDFIALRLSPGQGIRAMQPVRVVTEGADLTLPLRMVAAGVGANVGITLYVVGEGRYHPQNFPDVTIDESKLVWSFSANKSNYQELSDEAMRSSPGGAGWLTEYAGMPRLHSYGSASNGAGTLPLADTYDAACAKQTFQRGPLPDADGGAQSDAQASDAATDASDSGDAARDAQADAADDGGTESDAGPPVSGHGGRCDDFTLATNGLAVSDIWVTRVRAILPVAALGVGDLRLEATMSQTPVSQIHYAHDASSPVTPTSQRYGSLVTVGGGMLGLSALLRRRRR